MIERRARAIAPERGVLSGVLILAVVVTVVNDASHEPAWRSAIGWAATVVLCPMLVAVFGGGRFGRWRMAGAIGLAASASTLVLAFTGGATTWIGYLGVIAAGLVPTAGWLSVVIALPPVVALGIHSWWLADSTWAPIINVGAAIITVAYVIARTREREAEELASAQRAVIEEQRARAIAVEQQREIAAQLHDVLAHTLSGLVITLQGASVAARKENVSADLDERLRTAISLARDGLSGARSAVGSLRGDGDAGPASGDADSEPIADWLARTIDRSRASTGLEATVYGDADVVPSGWRGLVRSLLMEGLTNSIRHAPGAPVRIEFCGPVDVARPVDGARPVDDADTAVDHAPTPITVRVLSVGDVTTFGRGDTGGGGHGIIGLRERVEAAGGSLSHGATDGGFLLELRTAP
ncbi:sensor histidine kinase [Gordonia soli]|uniref:histidine kinase n=1 Tax=Gordonia soli NBRC 108243 TaxID=1223545 RepID=M0QG68_9ACTN|nr:histidine kinase [Gordonia soli]GAC67625.1 putative two-component histidine kinase [Gordonia soli NBRC 108243]